MDYKNKIHLWLKSLQREQASIKRNLKKMHLFRIWGHRLFENVLWKIDKRSIAGGISLGLFAAFMPVIGFQMFVVAFGAILFKVNLPIALAACWITNPLTAFPIYFTSWRLGKYLLEDFTPFKQIFDFYNIEGNTVKVVLHGLYLWTGSLIFSSASAIIANIAVRWLWNFARHIKHTQTTPPTIDAQ